MAEIALKPVAADIASSWAADGHGARCHTLTLPGAIEAPLPADQFRSVLGHFVTGVAVVSAIDGSGQPVGLTIQAFSSLSLDPPLVLICPARSSSSWPKVEAAGRCCVNVLAEDQADLAKQFARSGGDKFAGVTWAPAPASGSPILSGILAWIDCRVEQVVLGGDHLIAVCRVLGLGAAVERRPLVYFRAGFRQVT